MTRERVELEIHSEEMRYTVAFAASFQKMTEQTNDVLSFFNVFEKNLYFA